MTPIVGLCRLPSQRPGRDAGFTLVEILVSTLIVGMVIYLAALSCSIFLRAWEAKRFTDTRALYACRNRILLRSALESITDYYITDPVNEPEGIHYPFFRGTIDSIEFITLSSVFQKGSPAVARLRLSFDDLTAANEPALIYEETSLDEKYIKYNHEQPKYENQLDLYLKVTRFKISYYGLFDTIWTPERERFEIINKWQDVFQGKDKNTIPEIIKLDLVSDDEEFLLIFQIRNLNFIKRGVFIRVM